MNARIVSLTLCLARAGPIERINPELLARRFKLGEQ